MLDRHQLSYERVGSQQTSGDWIVAAFMKLRQSVTAAY